MAKFLKGQRARVVCPYHPWNGKVVIVGPEREHDKKDYNAYLDERESSAFSSKYTFYDFQLAPLDVPGMCNKCSSLTPKDRTICCSCKKDV